MSRNLNLQLPFQAGEFKGRGMWTDSRGERGEYTAAFKIVEEADNLKTQITRRVFLKADGGVLYEEDSRVTFKITAGHFLEVTLAADEKEYVGQGYCFNTSGHFDIDPAEDNHLENTYFFSREKIELLGSATNKGNFTIWMETLYAVD